MREVVCIYHGNCADGFGAAWSVRFAAGKGLLPKEIDFYPGVYQQDPPDVTGKLVIMVDFSYKRPVIESMAEQAAAILIIDHHKSAQEDLAAFPAPPYPSGWLPGSGVYALFDMNRSGAVMAWDYFNEGEIARPRLLEHIQDRDLWKFELEGTREIQANIFSYPYDFEVWDRLMAEGCDSLRKDGAAIERKHFKDIHELLEVCERPMTIGGKIVPVASLPYTLTSDAGHKMAESAPFAACYWDTAEQRIFSLRSVEGGEDVSEIAKQYGGGGHKNAAGFAVPRDHELAMA